MKNSLVIAKSTYLELVRGKILYTVFFFAIAVVAVCALFGSVSIGDFTKVVLSFSLFSCSFFTVTFAVVSGSSLVFKEISKKTIFNILAKPVKRKEFLIGKYLGMLMTVSVMLGLMLSGVLIFLLFQDSNYVLPAIKAGITIFAQLVIICAAAIFFSSLVVTPLLSGAFTFGLFITGRCCEYLKHFIDNPELSPTLRSISSGLYYVLPHLDFMDASDTAVNLQAIEPGFILWNFIYAFAYAGILLVLAIVIFEKREFK